MTWKWRGPGLVVYCQEASHSSRLARIAWFTRDPNAPADAGWNPVPILRLPVAAWLDKDDAPVDLAQCGPDEMERVTRARHSLRCPLCGLSLSIKPQRLSAALDRLNNAGVSEVPLRALAATLT